MPNPIISICIPVYGTETSLLKCLESLVPVLEAESKSVEVLILNDCSSGCDSFGQNCKQIVNQFKKSLKKAKIKVAVEYLEHSQNKGTNETRRDLVFAAKGKYISMIDSDDTIIPEKFLEILSEIKNNSTDFDIISSKTKDSTNQSNSQLENHQIFTSFLVEHIISSFLWSNFIKRETFLDAYDKIPPTFCTYAEDFMVMFFITWFSKSYKFFNTCFYNYNRENGITSKTKIDSLERWKKVCSTASVFSVIYYWIEEQEQILQKNPLTQQEIDSLGHFAVSYLSFNLKQFDQMVVPELKPQAHQMLCDYWGQSLVEKVERNQKEKVQ